MLVDVLGRDPTKPAVPPGVNVGLELLPEVLCAVVIPQLEGRLPGVVADGTAVQGLVDRRNCSLPPAAVRAGVCLAEALETVVVPPVGTGGAAQPLPQLTRQQANLAEARDHPVHPLLTLLLLQLYPGEDVNLY